MLMLREEMRAWRSFAAPAVTGLQENRRKHWFPPSDER
jgi:hypothetical protein